MFILTSQLAPTKSFSTLLFEVLTYLTHSLYVQLAKEMGAT